MKYEVNDKIEWFNGVFVPIIAIEYGSYVTPYGRISSVYDDEIKAIEE